MLYTFQEQRHNIQEDLLQFTAHFSGMIDLSLFLTCYPTLESFKYAHLRKIFIRRFSDSLYFIYIEGLYNAFTILGNCK